MAAYDYVEPGEGKSYDWKADHIFVKATMAATGDRVTVVEDALKPGFALARHFHKVMTEVFYVLDGRVTFVFDDATVVAEQGGTLTIPPGTWHAVSSDGAVMITVFAPGGFEGYLAELASLDAGSFEDEGLQRALAERYDTWTE